MSATAKHLGVELNWTIDHEAAERSIGDGPSLSAAVTNLILNALQEANHVDVSVIQCESDQIRIDVVDNGNGPPADVADEIFEPFVTSKPEGLGLGLPLVARSAKRLGGGVAWRRDGDQTRFTLSLPVTVSD